MLRFRDLGKNIVNMEYAVRGPIVIRAQELERQGREVIYCNIGNPQALKQKPLTYFRQVLAGCEYPPLIEQKGIFPADVVEVVHRVLEGSRHGLGAYSESAGMSFVREAVAQFIQKRDAILADRNNIFLTDGASKAAQSVLRLLIAQPEDGVMVPIPQYPLYSATITFFGAHQVGYFLEESKGWQLSLEKLEASYQQALSKGIRVRALVVINPGNPTGAVLDYENINMIIGFAKKYHLSLIADEVYQENIYLPGSQFVSFAKVFHDRDEKDITLFSLHSCSKGFLGECGHRGGYVECRNLAADVAEQLLKLQSVSLCSNLPGQVMTYLMVKPPEPGEPSFEKYWNERNYIIEELKEKALILAEGLNQIPGFSCVPVAGAMYAFPKITLKPGESDQKYCMDLLENTGICVVPGAGFGQEEGTFHFRTTILPPKNKIKELLQLLKKFQTERA